MKKSLLIISCLLNFYTSIGQIELNEKLISFDEIEIGQCYNLCPENSEYKFKINEAIFTSQIDTLEKGITPDKNSKIDYGNIVIKKWSDNFCHKEGEKRNAICFVELKDTSKIKIIGTFDKRKIIQRKILSKNASIKFLSEGNKKMSLKKILPEYFSRGVTIGDIKKRLIALGYKIKFDSNFDDETKKIIKEINLKIGEEPNILSKGFLKHIGLIKNESKCICEK